MICSLYPDFDNSIVLLLACCTRTLSYNKLELMYVHFVQAHGLIPGGLVIGRIFLPRIQWAYFCWEWGGVYIKIL